MDGLVCARCSQAEALKRSSFCGPDRANIILANSCLRKWSSAVEVQRAQLRETFLCTFYHTFAFGGAAGRALSSVEYLRQWSFDGRPSNILNFVRKKSRTFSRLKLAKMVKMGGTHRMSKIRYKKYVNQMLCRTFPIRGHSGELEHGYLDHATFIFATCNLGVQFRVSDAVHTLNTGP